MNFALCQLGRAPAEPRDPGFQENKLVEKMDGWMALITSLLSIICSLHVYITNAKLFSLL